MKILKLMKQMQQGLQVLLKKKKETTTTKKSIKRELNNNKTLDDATPNKKYTRF